MRSGDFRHFDNLLGGLGIGAVVTAAWWGSGGLGYAADHPETLQEAFIATNFGRSEALSIVAPVAHFLDWLMFFSDKSKALTLGIVSVPGVVAGSAVYSLSSRNFRWEGFHDARDTGTHLVGAALMGVAVRPGLHGGAGAVRRVDIERDQFRRASLYIGWLCCRLKVSGMAWHGAALPKQHDI